MNAAIKSSALAALVGWCALVASAAPAAAPDPKTMPGFRLFQFNCAHCHGDDARGDEGPDLHGLLRGDTRLTKTIQNGIKGEMPAFGKKLNDDDVRDLIAWLRTLK